MDKNKVLSVSRSVHALQRREILLRNAGVNVISVSSLFQAEFEISMGTCGVLLICHLLGATEAQTLVDLYRQNSPHGRIVLVSDDANRSDHPPVEGIDFVLPQSAESVALLQAVDGTA